LSEPDGAGGGMGLEKLPDWLDERDQPDLRLNQRSMFHE
jgi:hypothetical protein